MPPPRAEHCPAHFFADLRLELSDDLLVVRARSKPGGGTASSGIQAFVLFFKLIALLVVLFAALAAGQNVALTAGLTYGLAYTFELGLSLASYFGTPSV